MGSWAEGLKELPWLCHPNSKSDSWQLGAALFLDCSLPVRHSVWGCHQKKPESHTVTKQLHVSYLCGLVLPSFLSYQNIPT